jgi:transposase
MIALNRRTKVFLSKEPADMRASYDSLFLRVRDIVKEDPFSGHLFVFLNKRRSSCKCLYYDGTGLVLICEGLFARVNPFHSADIVLTQAEFNLFFEGADLTKRFIDSPREVKKSSPPRPSLQHSSAINS